MHGVMLIPIANNNSVMRTLQRTGIVKYIMTLKALRFLAQEKLKFCLQNCFFFNAGVNHYLDLFNATINGP